MIATAMLVTACAKAVAPAGSVSSATPIAQAPATAIPVPTDTAVPATTAYTAGAPTATAALSTIASSQGATTSANGATYRVDMDKIFPPGKGRDLVLNNCTACHNFVRVVIGQRDHGGWLAVRASMGPRVNSLSKQDLDDLFGYLEANFNDTKPVPDLPDWLRSSY